MFLSTFFFFFFGPHYFFSILAILYYTKSRCPCQPFSLVSFTFFTLYLFSSDIYSHLISILIWYLFPFFF